ncbi:MAG: PQQ-binding-like beta-propeller repeat protein, partial [Gemmatimonadetes bacterium]|nr:PQQ-binding-like beta-propeller repeat protein [Gemmatimonadota bacterium]
SAASVVALHAGTGRELWKNPLEGVPAQITNRGIMYWENVDRSERRVFTSKGQHLHAVDALTGGTVSSFGTNGRIDLRQDLGRTATRGQSPSPGRVFENLIILGSAPGENYASDPGHIRAYDARTGQLVWRFNTVPYPGEFGYETWPSDAYKRIGGANAWGGLSVDENRGIVYVPIASPSYDFYGADRLGSNLFGNSLLALDARTGKRLWHFQTVHHDLWDMDLTATPTLLTVRHKGRMRDVVAQATKLGYLYVFDRVTGESLWPIEERPVPASDMPGELAWPTQPRPTWPKPFAVQSFTPDDVNPYIPAAEQDSVRRRLAEILNLSEALHQPPSTRPTMQMPGNRGGANWGSTAADPRNGEFYVVAENLPTVLQLTPILPGTFGTGTSQLDRGLFLYTQNCQACHKPTLEGTPPLIPALRGVNARMPSEAFHQVVREGRRNMPAFPDLSAQEVSAILLYLTTPEAAEPIPSAPMGPDGRPLGPVRYQTGYGYFAVSSGMFARKPPFAAMTKYDLNSGEILWQTPLGEVPALVGRGVTDLTGASSLRGGPALTAGGLVFMITKDKLRAYDTDTGRQLWAGQMPRPGDGIPAVYRVGGRQYVVASAAAAAVEGTPDGPRVYVAFALPPQAANR